MLQLHAADFGAVAAVGPLLVQASPSASVRALSSVEVDISKIQPGQGIKTTWRKQPVFIKQLTPAEIQAANATPIAWNSLGAKSRRNE